MSVKNLSETIEFEFDEIRISKEFYKNQIFQNLHKCIKKAEETAL
jgi:hypothetical protein